MSTLEEKIKELDLTLAVGRGELVKAYIVKDSDEITSEELIEYCAQNLASFKAPRSIEFLDALPRNAMGKLQLKNLPNRETL